MGRCPGLRGPYPIECDFMIERMEGDEELDWDDTFVYTDQQGSSNAKEETCVIEAEDSQDFDTDVHQYLAKCGLKVMNLSGKGRGLVAEKDFKAGDCVLRQLPLAYCLSTSDDSIKTRCGYCLGTTKTPKRCSKCKVVHYCCVEHQKKDWPIHSAECTRMMRCVDANQAPTATIIMLGRILDVKAKDKKPSKASHENVPGTRFRDLIALASLQRQHSQESIISFSQVSKSCLLLPCQSRT